MAPVLHVFPVEILDVKITLSPTQKVVGPFAEITGAAGCGFEFIVTEVFADVQPFASVTFNV